MNNQMNEHAFLFLLKVLIPLLAITIGHAFWIRSFRISLFLISAQILSISICILGYRTIPKVFIPNRIHFELPPAGLTWRSTRTQPQLSPRLP
jgi:hypothetical protein